MSSLLKYFFIFIFIFTLISCYAVIFILNPIDAVINSDINSSSFIWPTPNYHQITSYFGYRNSPFTGKTSYHSGIDIGAPQGSDVLASFSGIITYIGFMGANGYSIQISNGIFIATYSHLSPHFFVYLGQEVMAGEVIAIVGPKNVYGVANNPYKDSNGNPTNGSTTGPHLHLSLKKDR